MKKFKCISIYYDTKCNRNCKGCYVDKTLKPKPKKFWYDLTCYLGKLTNQVAFAGYEPFMNPEFIRDFSTSLKNNKIIANITTNGKLIKEFGDLDLKYTLVYITMVSVSFNRNLIKNKQELLDYKESVRRLKLAGVKVGATVLLDKAICEKLEYIVPLLFDWKVDSVYLLVPKPLNFNIFKYKPKMIALSLTYKEFYCDDCLIHLIQEEKFDWNTPCHYGQDFISIDPEGNVKGCSFSKEVILKLNKPEDILKMENIEIKKKYKCPYLKCQDMNRNQI